ncbi:MAG: ABC transporter ATP-binding protein, partial [Rubrivivax sp.]
ALVARPRLLLLERPELGLGEAELTSLLLAVDNATAAGAAVLVTSSHPRVAASAQRRVALDGEA